MPTGLQVNSGLAQMGNINIQAVKSQSENSNFGSLNVVNAAVVGGNQIISDGLGNITTNPIQGVVPVVNQFQSMMTTIPPIIFQAVPFATFNASALTISPILTTLASPIKLKGISDQRPEIVSLVDFDSIYEQRHGTDMSDTGDFINISIAARKLRFDHIEALIESIQEVEDANAILKDIADGYADQVIDARKTVSLMSKVARLIKNVKKSLDVRRSENLKDEKFAKNIVTSLSYKTFLVEQYGFSDSGFSNFSNTKILGQFFRDIKNTIKQYSPTLFGTTDPTPPNNFNAEVGGLTLNQPSVNESVFNLNYSLGVAEGEQTVERSVDRDFGTYNTADLNITDSQFAFQVRLFRNVGFPILGTPFNQFLDLLPVNTTDRTLLLLMTLSKELRISNGLGSTKVKNMLFNTFGGNETSDPFDFIIGEPGDTIAEPIVGGNSLCSLLRHVNGDGDIVLPFESAYVRGDDGRLFTPGSKELADSILQSEEPYDISKLKEYQKRVSNISTDSISLIRKLLGSDKKKSRIGPISIFNEIGRDFIESVDLLISKLPKDTLLLPGSWGEASLIKLALSDREIKQLLFQYVLTLGMIGKPSDSQFGNSSVEPFFREMSRSEIAVWGDLPVVSEDSNLNTGITIQLNSILEKLGINVGNDQSQSTTEGGATGSGSGGTVTADSIATTPTSDSISGYTVLAFIAQTLVSRIKAKGDQSNGDFPLNSSVILTMITSHLISTKHLVFLNRIADFISTITNRADDYANDDGRSRLNRLSPTALAAFAFEAYLSFIDPLLEGVSAPNTGNEVMNINFSTEALRNSQTLITLLIGNYGSFAATLTALTPQEKFSLFTALNAQALASPTGNIQFKLLREESIVNQILLRIQRTFELVESATSNAVDFLNPNGPKAGKLLELIESQGGKERVAMINEAQFVLSRKALRDFNSGEGLSLVTRSQITFRGQKSNRGQKYRLHSPSNGYHFLFLARRLRIKQIDIPVFVDGSVITNNQKKLMELVLKRPKFRGRHAKNLKILTVGLPAGFSDNFDSEIGVGAENIEDVLDKERDVIGINVYRRSVDFEDVVFKPKTYLFETSRFVMKAEIERIEIEDSRFRDFLNDRSIEFMRDFSDRPRGNIQNQESFFANEEYSFLTQKQKKKLVINHIESFVLGLYLQILTGVSTDENEYLVDEALLEGFVDDDAKERFNDLVLTYIKGVTKEPITLDQLKNSSPQIKALLEKIDNFRLETSFTEQIAPPDLPGTSVPVEQRIELTEDLINFVKLFNPKTLLTGGNVHALRITSPKIFERIFNLAVDPDDFEIDLDKTFATQSGQKMYATLEKMGLLKTPTRIRQRNKNRTISLDQFFVNISTVGDTE